MPRRLLSFRRGGDACVDFVWWDGLGDASVPTLLHATPAPTGVVVRGDGLGGFVGGDGLGDASVPMGVVVRGVGLGGFFWGDGLRGAGVPILLDDTAAATEAAVVADG